MRPLGHLVLHPSHEACDQLVSPAASAAQQGWSGEWELGSSTHVIFDSVSYRAFVGLKLTLLPLGARLLLDAFWFLHLHGGT